ncbi:MAG: M20/M25/M40 family metallo-hydrolase [Actinomycetota bacterium]|nr:M20/M25/M40 family metallo-hydrolase [Actinomycetota bacterium]
MADIATGEVVELLRALIRNRCVNDGSDDSGHEHRSVATLQQYLGAEGEVVEPHPGRQSVVFTVPGSTPGAPSLLLLPHLDVVPVTPSGWTRDPFAAEIDDGFVWGRGAIDMLNVTAAVAAVFSRYLSGALPPLPGDLVLAAVADEEAGGEFGAGWLSEQRPDLLPADFVLTEIATPHVVPGGGLPVTVAEKGPSWKVLATRGTPGHASQPYRSDNALIPLAEVIGLLDAATAPVAVSAQWATFVAGAGFGDDLASRLVDPDRLDEAIDELAASDAPLARFAHACTHLTVAPTMFTAGTKSNVIPDSAEAHLDMRLVPGQDESDVADHLRKVLGPDRLDRIEVIDKVTAPGNASPADGVLWEAIGDAAETHTGSRDRLPMLIPVTTDARHLRGRGAISYGVGLFDDRMGFGEMLTLFHGNDERVSIGSLTATTALLATTVARFGERLAETT